MIQFDLRIFFNWVVENHQLEDVEDVKWRFLVLYIDHEAVESIKSAILT